MGILRLNRDRKWNKEFALNGANAELIYPPEIGANDNRIVELTHVYVNPNHRGKGRASTLLNKIKQYAKQQKIKLFIRVRPYGTGTKLSKIKLVKFYESRGFVKYTAEDDYFILDE